MARLPCLVLPGIPHHVTQRGNRRERTFFEEGGFALYLDLLADAAERAGVEIWPCCLMPNQTCTADPEARNILADQLREIGDVLPDLPNERLVYRCRNQAPAEGAAKAE